MTPLAPSQLEGLLHALPDPAFVLSASGRYLAVYGGTDMRYYHDGRWLVGRRLDEVLAADKARWFLDHVQQALRSGQLQVVEYSLAGSDLLGGSDSGGPSAPIWFEGRVQALDFQIDGEAAVLWVASNISHRHALETRLRQLSETDELTGLANRRQLMRHLEDHFERFSRYQTACALLVFDIDLFKRINDQWGHQGGDRALQLAAAMCQQEIRANDTAARLGGDEFVLLLPHTDLAQAAQIAERLRAGIERALAGGFEPGASSPSGPGATISVGVSAMHAHDRSHLDALRRADEALYRAKAQGRNQVQLGSS